MDNIPDDLLKLKVRFDQWRATRKTRSEPIPDELRSEALDMTKRFSSTLLLKVLKGIFAAKVRDYGRDLCIEPSHPSLWRLRRASSTFAPVKLPPSLGACIVCVYERNGPERVVVLSRNAIMSKVGEELLESVKQMAAIERGEMEPARETVYDRRSKKVRVNIYLDKDIVEHFKKQAAAPSADAYQTQINRALRAAVEGLTTDQPDINTLADLIAQKVAACISKPPAKRSAMSKRAAATAQSRKSPKSPKRKTV